jgi:hypothetical protein
MYEFHGWVNIVAAEPGEGSWQEDQAAIAALMERLREAREQVGGWFEVRETSNGQIVVVAHGLRNHRRGGALELFRWIGERYPWSYGLLFVLDDEDPARGNEFVVYRLARGVLTEHADALLSPAAPTIEPSLEELEDLPRRKEARARLDREFYDALGPERPDVPWRSPGCRRGAVALSVMCRRHHFEQVKRRPCRFDDGTQ